MEYRAKPPILADWNTGLKPPILAEKVPKWPKNSEKSGFFDLGGAFLIFGGLKMVLESNVSMSFFSNGYLAPKKFGFVKIYACIHF